MAEAWIGLGANLDRPLDQLRQAARRLGAHPQIDLLQGSSLYRSRPWGDQDQPDFLNAVVQVRTTLAPHALLQTCQQVELELGRVRDPQRPWGPRRVDLDLLLYDAVQMNTEDLVLPHPWLSRRAFVLQPLLELWPDARLPDGTDLQEALAGLNEGCIRLSDRLLERANASVPVTGLEEE